MPELAPGLVLSGWAEPPGLGHLAHVGIRNAISFPAREDEERVVSMKPPSFRTSMARDRCTPGLDTAEVQRGTRPMASHQSSLTSLEESGPSGLLPRKALLQAGGSHAEVSVPVEWPEDSLVFELFLPFYCFTLLLSLQP